MRLLFLGDVVGRSGRDAVCALLPQIRARLGIDFAVVNGENAAHGFGLTEAICRQFYEAGADVVTTGNHTWDQREIIAYIGSDPRLLRPINFPPGTPGRGLTVMQTRAGQKVVVVNVMTRLFMDPLDDPFAAMEKALAPYPLGGAAQAIIVDVHGEATSEKMSMGHFLDGRTSLVVGTHSHIPTADAHVLVGGTAYMTDAGMCGDYDSVIGMKKGPAVARFVRKMPGERLSPADGEATVCGVLVETDDRTGLAKSCAPLRLGGRLASAWPGDGEAVG
ncbi:MAG: YmdB family metallophosphoesterase [Alphaproteobacteria bacterium]